MQYHSKVTDSVCSIKLKREEFSYVKTIFNFHVECILIYMLLFYQISAWVFVIHMFLYASFYCTTHEQTIICRQLFAGHVVGSRPMKRKEKMHRMINAIIIHSKYFPVSD